jgi:protein SCO1
VIRQYISLTIFAATILLPGCHKPAPQDQSSTANSQYKIYKLKGKVMSTNAKSGEVTVNHEAIAGFMEAMTMPYKVKDPNILGELHPGDVITADVLVSQDADADIVLDHIVVVAQGKPDYKPMSQYHVPAPGDMVPDFKLRNQDGRTISLSQFRGKQLLVTFIYTRCPMPDFCPRVTRQFAEIDRQLQADAAIYGKTHLLCVSFDPENDTPARLRAYGATYMGSDAKSAFAHWDFAVPDKATVDKMALYFDVGLTRDSEATITHTLSTTLIGTDGKVREFYPGNDWTVDQVLADVKHATGA